MKKFLVVSILLMYMSSVFFIAFFGMEIATYQPMIYIEEIYYTYSFPVKEPNLPFTPFKDSSGRFVIGFNYMHFDVESEENPNIVLITYGVVPATATKRDVSIITTSSKDVLEIEGTNIIFNPIENNSSESATVYITSNDGGNTIRSIRFVVIY